MDYMFRLHTYCKDDITRSHIGKHKDLTWKVINGKRVWLSKEGV